MLVCKAQRAFKGIWSKVLQIICSFQYICVCVCYFIFSFKKRSIGFFQKDILKNILFKGKGLGMPGSCLAHKAMERSVIKLQLE